MNQVLKVGYLPEQLCYLQNTKIEVYITVVTISKLANT